MSRSNLTSGACLTVVAAAAPCADALAQQASPYRPERFEEDWRVVDTDEVVLGDWKDLDVAGASVSIGGDARWRFAWLDAPHLGIDAAADGWLAQRLLLHADMRFEDDARIFVQLGAHDTIGREIHGSSDDNQFAVTQAFIDLNAHITDARITLRAGRQELVLGSPRFVTARDNGNIRQRHDLLRLSLRDGRWSADLFGGEPTQDGRGVLDDEADAGQRFYGARILHGGEINTELALFKLDRDQASLGSLTAADDRWSLSARVGGRRGSFDIDAEAVAQWGDFGDQEIEAYGFFGEIARRFDDAAWAPRLGARVSYGSGDSDQSDDKQQTFAPPFPQSTWFGQNGLASYSNTAEIAATLGLSPRDDVSVSAKLSALWRADASDYLYTASGPLPGTAGGDAYVGDSANLGVTWRPSLNTTIVGYVSYFDASEAVRDFGGRDVSYAQLVVSFRF